MSDIRSRLKREFHQSVNSRFARNAGWLAAGQGTGFFLQGVYFVMLARLLGRDDYGIFAGAFAFSSLVSQYSPLGTGTVFLRHVSRDPGAFGVHWGNILATTFVFGGFISIVLIYIGKHILNPSSAALVMFAAVANVIFAQLTTETGRVFQAFEKMKISAMMGMLTSLVRTITAGSMLLFMHHATARQWAIAALFISAASATTAAVIVTINFGRPRFVLHKIFHASAEGVGYSFAASASSVYNDIDKTMLSHYGMNAANGIYTMAYRIVDMAAMPIISIRDAALPRLFKSGSTNLDATSTLTIRLFKRAAPIALVAAAGMFLFAGILPKIVGHGYAETVVALRWLCLIPLFRSVHQMTGSALTGAGLQSYRTASQVSAAILNIVLNFHWIPMYGWRGAAWASLATDGALAVVTAILFKIKIFDRRHVLQTDLI
jgi:O-antigen/teichoic acid export membrane protein